MRHGFTIIETILYIAVFSVLVSGIIPLTVILIKSEMEARKFSNYHTKMNFLDERMEKIFMLPVNIIEPSLGESSSNLVIESDGLISEIDLGLDPIEQENITFYNLGEWITAVIMDGEYISTSTYVLLP